nr:Chain N, GLY-SER-HIS-GLY-HIS-HIS-HIS-HIS-HIS [Homo sapiens]
GSHGHHHHH